LENPSQLAIRKQENETHTRNWRRNYAITSCCKASFLSLLDVFPPLTALFALPRDLSRLSAFSFKVSEVRIKAGS